MDPRTRLLLEAPIAPTLLRLGAPNVLVMLAQAGAGLIETYFVGQLGTDALAGMALAFPLVMLMQMTSAGAMGGGIASAIARALGAQRRDDAQALVMHAVLIAVGFGLVFMLGVWLGGRALFVAMGGTGAALDAALTYSYWVFGGAVLVWLFNALSAVIRGTGNMLVPAVVTVAGTVLLVPLSPLLIFGWGPVPAMGIAGGALALLLYYAIGSAVLLAWLGAERGVLKPVWRGVAYRWVLFRDILRVGLMGAVSTFATNLAIVIATALVGRYGTAAIAGYGTASRLEYLLVPLVFGLGAPLVAMVGMVATRKGAWLFHGDARRKAWRSTARTSWATSSATCARPARRPHAAGRGEDRPPGPTDLPLHRLRPQLEGGRQPPAFANAASGLPARAVDHTFWLTPGHASERGSWYAGTSPQGLFRSEDGGDTWRRCRGQRRRAVPPWMGTVQDGTPDGPKLHSVIVDPRDPAHLLFGMSGGGVHESRDAGAQLAHADPGPGGGGGLRRQRRDLPRPALLRLCPTTPTACTSRTTAASTGSTAAAATRPPTLAAHRPQDAQARGRHRLPDGRAPARRRHRLGVPDGRHRRLAAHQPRRPAGGLRHAQRRAQLAAAGPGPAGRAGLVDRQAPGHDGGCRSRAGAVPGHHQRRAVDRATTKARAGPCIARHLPEIYAVEAAAVSRA
jgi:putative MATE family efflux protein